MSCPLETTELSTENLHRKLIAVHCQGITICSTHLRCSGDCDPKSLHALPLEVDQPSCTTILWWQLTSKGTAVTGEGYEPVNSLVIIIIKAVLSTADAEEHEC